MAAEIEEVDLVVGGHSHTFLYSGDDLPSNNQPRGPYPTYVTQPSTGKVVPVVQAYCYTKYMGHLTLNIDKASGDLVTPVDGAGVERAEVIFLDSGVEQDQDVLDRLAYYKANLTEYTEVLGRADLDLTQFGYGVVSEGHASIRNVFLF